MQDPASPDGPTASSGRAPSGPAGRKWPNGAARSAGARPLASPGEVTDDARVSLDGPRTGATPTGRAPLRPRRRLRSFFAVLLIVLAAVLAPVSTAAVWARDVVGDRDHYVATMRPLAADPAVRAAVTDRVADAVMEYVSVKALLGTVDPDDRSALDPAIGALDGPVAAGLRNLVHSAVGSFVSGPAFATIWTQLNREAHVAAEKALTSDRGTAVTVDLAPVAEAAKRQLLDDGLSVASKIPTVHARLTLVDSEAVGRARTGFRLLRTVGPWLPVATVLSAAGGVLLAVRRRRALITLALLIAGGALLLGLGLVVFRSQYLDRLTSGIPHPAAAAVFNALTAFLRIAVRMIAVTGAVVALTAWLGGTGRVATRVRSGWRGGIGALREAMGLRTGRAGLRVLRARSWLNGTVVAVALAAYLVWDRPTLTVVAGIALLTLIALAAVELLADDGVPDAGTGATSERARPDRRAAR